MKFSNIFSWFKECDIIDFICYSARIPLDAIAVVSAPNQKFRVTHAEPLSSDPGNQKSKQTRNPKRPFASILATQCRPTWCSTQHCTWALSEIHMSCSLNSLKRDYDRGYLGVIMGVTKADTISLE